jgi:hypothetical protein
MSTRMARSCLTTFLKERGGEQLAHAPVISVGPETRPGSRQSRVDAT